MNEPCDCGWCGNCRDEVDQQQKLEERSDYQDDERESE